MKPIIRQPTTATVPLDPPSAVFARLIQTPPINSIVCVEVVFDAGRRVVEQHVSVGTRPENLEIVPKIQSGSDAQISTTVKSRSVWRRSDVLAVGSPVPHQGELSGEISQDVIASRASMLGAALRQIAFLCIVLGKHWVS